MKPILFFFALFYLQFSAYAQQGYIYFEKEDIRKDFLELAEKNSKYTFSIKDSSGVLKIDISGFEKITCEFEFDADGVCNHSNFIYCCDDCSDKHIKSFVENKYYKWVMKTPGLYYSKRKYHTQMEIFNSNPTVTVITFTKIDWTRKQYKALIKKR